MIYFNFFLNLKLIGWLFISGYFGTNISMLIFKYFKIVGIRSEISTNNTVAMASNNTIAMASNNTLAVAMASNQADNVTPNCISPNCISPNCIPCNQEEIIHYPNQIRSRRAIKNS